MTETEAKEQKYLEEKTLVIMPSPRGGKMVKDPAHIAYFKMDGTTTSFCLPRNERGDLAKVFKDDAERKFFEETLGLDLNEKKPGSYFEKLHVNVTKDVSLMHKGYAFDMSDPMDNLRARVVSKDPSVAPSWDERLNRVEYQWAIIDESELTKEAETEYDSVLSFGMYLGRIDGDIPKMRKSLMIYYASLGSSKKVPIDAGSDLLKKEFNAISSDKLKRESFLNIVNAPLFAGKLIALQGLESGAIKKDGENSYLFTGDEADFTFNGIATKINELKEIQDDVYFKLMDQIEKHNK